jgi:hypothetical protein
MADPPDPSSHQGPTEPSGPGPGPIPGGDPSETGGHARGSGPEAGGRPTGPDEWARALGGHPTECLDWCPICRTADVLRATASPELKEQFHQIQREALVTVRAIIDHYIERLDEQPRRATPVEEIPIE